MIQPLRAPRQRRVGVLLAVAAVLALPMPAQSADTMAEQAAKAYREAHGLMRLQRYPQTADLFQQFIRRYGTNENAVEAQFYLGVCLRSQNLDEEYVKQLELCSRIYAGTEAELIALNGLLNHYHAKKDFENYIATVKELTGPTGHKPVVEYMLDPGEWHYRGSNLQGARRYYTKAFNEHFDDLCKGKPENAKQLLELLAGTFKNGPGYLPVEWHWTHVYLHLLAGQEDEAKQTLAVYDKYWGDDVRGAGLQYQWAEYLRGKNRLDEAIEVCRAIMERWEGTLDSAAGEAAYRLAGIYEQKDDGKALIAMAEPVVQRYAKTRWGNAVRAILHKKLIEQASTDPKAAERAFVMFEEDMLDMLPPERADSLQKQIELALTLKMEDKAAALFAKLCDRSVWSGYTWARIQTLVGKHAAFKPMADKLGQSYIINAPSPDSEPAKLLEQLKTRMADGQLRFCEEIAQEMFTKHPEAAETLDGLKRMVDYYFTQVMPEPRDKWMGRMIATYEYHPDTEEVLNQRCIAANASAEYEQLAADVDMAMARFPASRYRNNWVGYRQKAYDAMKDQQGEYDLLLKEYGPRIRSGNMYSLGQLIQELPIAEGQDRYEMVARAWMGWADQFGDTHPALNCLAQARRYFESSKTWDKAHVVSTRLRTQKIDPSVAHAYQFDDIDLYLAANEHAKVAAAASRLAKYPHPRFRGGRRFSLPSVGMSFGRAGQVSAGTGLAKRLMKLYDAPEDINDAEAMLAYVYIGAEEGGKPAPRAHEHLMNVVERINPPDLAYRLFLGAAHHRPPNKGYDDLIDNYLKRIPRAHHIKPDLLKREAEYLLSQRDRKTLAIQRALQSGYPASKARDDLDARLKRARERSR